MSGARLRREMPVCQGPTGWEFLNSFAAIFSNIDITFGVRRDARSLVELTREVAAASKARKDPAGLSVNDFHLRIVLVDEVDEAREES